MIPAFLENALALDLIPVPKQDISSDKFTRWAKTTAFGRKPCATALSTAIFPKPFPKAFFRKPRNIYPAHLSRCGAKPLSKNGWKPAVNKNAIGQSAPNALKKFGTGRNPFKRIRI